LIYLNFAGEDYMFLLNELKSTLNNGVVAVFIIISYNLIFKTGKNLKESGKYKDYRIVMGIGIFYGLFTVTAIVLMAIY
jgi:hypothetical protein